MKRNVLTYLLLPFLLALLVTACKDDTLPASPAEEEEAGSGVYVSVVVNTGGSNASRVPTPGEGGDGPQAGTKTVICLNNRVQVMRTWCMT